MKAVIVGAGIGGLSAALCLARGGWEVEVLEKAPVLGEVGAGLQISPNGVRVLEAMGVMDRLEASLFEPEAIEMRLGRSGRQVFRLPLKDKAVARWGARYIQIHRADLAEALISALQDVAPNALRTGASVTGYTHEGTQAVAHLASGKTAEGDVLIGADGLHSTIRTQMIGSETPRFTGNIAWRWTVPVDRLNGLLPPPSGCIWAGPHRHAVTTWLRGGREVNFVGVVERADWQEEGWDKRGDRDEAHSDFDRWHPVLRQIISAAEVHHRWALFDRAPLPTWSDGPVALLGDAAHPMLPSMAQGAVQAIEDAWELSRRLADATDIPAALKAHFAARIERVSRIQMRSARNLRLFHKSSFLGKAACYAPLTIASRAVPGLLHAQQDWIYGYDAVGSSAGSA
jgi:salicylate hydroxylase